MEMQEANKAAQVLKTKAGKSFLCSAYNGDGIDELRNHVVEVGLRYGRTEFGQRCLLARRLVESGVPMVNVSYCHTPRGSWDTHGNNFKSLRDSLAPTLDAAPSDLPAAAPSGRRPGTTRRASGGRPRAARRRR